MTAVVGAAGICSALLRPVGVSRSLSSEGNGGGVFVTTPLRLFAVSSVGAAAAALLRTASLAPDVEDAMFELGSLFAGVSELLVPLAAMLWGGSLRPLCPSVVEASLVDGLDAVADVPDELAGVPLALGVEAAAAVWP